MKNKKFYIAMAVIACIALALCVLQIATSATDEIPTPVETEAVVTESIPLEAEIVTEGEISATEEVIVDTPTVDEEIVEDTALTTDEIVEWAMANYDKLTVIFSVISGALVIVSKIKSVIKAVATSNNNAIVIAEDSKATTQAALAEINSVKDVVSEYKEEVAKLLAEVRETDEEKKALKTSLERVEGYLQTAKLANKELSNELAELLILANIPNAKKEELYSRHRAAIAALDAVEVKKNVGEET